MLDLLAAAAHFDVETATRAYLDTLEGPARVRSDAYFEGGYWLPLWATLIGVLADWLLLRFRIAHGFRALGERVSRRPWIVTWLTALLYLVAGTVLTAPWTIYNDYVREKQYGLVNQGFGAWAGEQAIDIGITLLIGPLIIMLVYALIRRAPKSWWLWSTVLVGTFLFIGMVLSPVFIAPLFNDYTELEAGPLRNRIVDIAAREDIPADHIYVVDESRQTKRISANVSGFGPTMRISLNDNLLNRTSEAEILAVMGHEMGHYKLNHGWWNTFGILAIFAGALFLAARIVPALIARHGEAWGVRNIADPASLPVLAIVFGLIMLLATPLTNSVIRTNEAAADAFGLDAAREPDGFATAAMRLSEYRKIEPGALEEVLFYDHPSGEARVRRSMQWKADHTANPVVVHPPKGYLDQ